MVSMSSLYIYTLSLVTTNSLSKGYLHPDDHAKLIIYSPYPYLLSCSDEGLSRSKCQLVQLLQVVPLSLYKVDHLDLYLTIGIMHHIHRDQVSVCWKSTSVHTVYNLCNLLSSVNMIYSCKHVCIFVCSIFDVIHVILLTYWYDLQVFCVPCNRYNMFWRWLGSNVLASLNQIHLLCLNFWVRVDTMYVPLVHTL